MDGQSAEPRFIRSRGLKIPDDPALLTRRMRRNLRNDTYERKECDAMMRVVREGDVVLELGAGIGYMSALISTRKKVAAIHCYEANPGLIPHIARVHEVNGVTNATVHNKLLAGEAVPPVDFFVREDFLASSLDRSSDPDTVLRIEKVEVADINAVLAELKPTVLVCDIEGAEAELLPKAKFETLRAAIIELHPQWVGQAGVRAVFDAMHRAGLTYFAKGSEGKVVSFRNE